MTTLNDHAQESENRFSCLSAANPENIPDVRKQKMIRSLRKHRSQTNRGRPPEGRGGPRGCRISEKISLTCSP